jgi:hypothetical protein
MPRSSARVQLDSESTASSTHSCPWAWHSSLRTITICKARFLRPPVTSEFALSFRVITFCGFVRRRNQSQNASNHLRWGAIGIMPLDSWPDTWARIVPEHSAGTFITAAGGFEILTIFDIAPVSSAAPALSQVRAGRECK